MCTGEKGIEMTLDDETKSALLIVTAIIIGIIIILTFGVCLETYLNRNYPTKKEYSFRLDDDQFAQLIHAIERTDK